jgi:hypothetical protein
MIRNTARKLTLAFTLALLASPIAGAFAQSSTPTPTPPTTTTPPPPSPTVVTGTDPEPGDPDVAQIIVIFFHLA